MATIEFILFDREHLGQMGIKPASWQEADVSRCTGWTMLVDGKPCGAAGVCPMWPGVAEAWMFVPSGWEKYRLAAVREIRRRLPQLMAEENLRRVQASCLEAPQYWGWLKLFGFAWEGVMQRYGLAGEDYIRAAVVK